MILCAESALLQYLVDGSAGEVTTVPLTGLSVQAERFDGVVSFDGFLGFVMGEPRPQMCTPTGGRAHVCVVRLVQSPTRPALWASWSLRQPLVPHPFAW